MTTSPQGPEAGAPSAHLGRRTHSSTRRPAPMVRAAQRARSTRIGVLATAIALALAACDPTSRGETSSDPARHADSWDASKPILAPGPLEAAPAHAFGSANPDRAVEGAGAGDAGHGEWLVREVMRHVGLPQNFAVIAHRGVPNALALIMQGPDGQPRRVIAYNPAFMAVVASKAGAHNWGPLAVMAHEIGHHLSGHTLLPGGSRPPIELEADRFSGFVLYKMGADLTQAQSVLRALPIEGGPTHPGRLERLAAVEAGWTDACRQTRDDCADGRSDPHATPPRLIADLRDAEGTASAEPRTAPAPPPLESENPATVTPQPAQAPGASEALSATPDRLPEPDPAAIPLKTTQFVWDELGLLDPETRRAHEETMRALAADHGVEVLTLVVEDLRGLSAIDFARAMARQLRAGKLDVGNGAVLVVAPRQRAGAAFLGPGLALEMRYHDKTAQLERWLDLAERSCAGADRCDAATTSLLLDAAAHIARDARSVGWQVRHEGFEDLLAALRDEAKDPLDYDPEKSAVYRALVRFDGRIVELDPGPGRRDVLVHDTEIAAGRRAAIVELAEGWRGVVYFDPASVSLMPSGALETGARYRMVARVESISDRREDTQSFDLLSWEALPEGTTTAPVVAGGSLRP